jgi:hypothetical protein
MNYRAGKGEGRSIHPQDGKIHITATDQSFAQAFQQQYGERKLTLSR